MALRQFTQPNKNALKYYLIVLHQCYLCVMVFKSLLFFSLKTYQSAINLIQTFIQEVQQVKFPNH